MIQTVHKTVHNTKLGRVHCTHTACAVSRTTPRSRACRAHSLRRSRACRAHSLRRSRAQHAQVERIATRSCAQVVTSFSSPSPGQVATSFPGRDLLDDQARSRRQSLVVTSLLPNQSKSSCDHKMGLQHQVPTGQVATSKQGRDTNG